MEIIKERRKAVAYQKLAKPVGNYGELEIEVNYSVGGVNYFSGTYNERGYRVSLSPVSRGSHGMTSRTMMGSNDESGYFIFLESAERFNLKKIAEWSAKVEAVGLQKIANLYAERKHREIGRLFVPDRVYPTIALLKSGGLVEEVKPANGTKFTLEELQAMVGGYIEIVNLNDGRCLVVNEEGKLNDLPVNARATRLYDRSDDVINGDAVLLPESALK